MPQRAVSALPLAVLTILALAMAKLAPLDEALLRATPDWLGPVRYADAFDFAQEALWNGLIAAALALHLLGMARVAPRLGDRTVRAIRWWARAGFSIYVVHYPVMHLMDAALSEDLPAKAVLFVLLPVAAGLAFAQGFERPLSRLRRWLGGAAGRLWTR